jgi:hypothetical protein
MKVYLFGLLVVILSSQTFAASTNYSCDVYRYVKNGPTQKDVVTVTFPLSTDPNEVNVYSLPNTLSQLVFYKTQQVGLFINKDALESYFQVPTPGVFPSSFNIASGDNTAGSLVRATCNLQ